MLGLIDLFFFFLLKIAGNGVDGSSESEPKQQRCGP